MRPDWLMLTGFKVATIAALCLSLTACLPSQPKTKDAPIPDEDADETGFYRIQVSAEEIPLSDDDPGAKRLGRATYLQGWHLTADHDRFGGFSGAVIKGDQFIAVSDQGDWMIATMANRLGANLAGSNVFTEARMLPFAEGRIQSKFELDAESLSPARGGILVGFEQEHRIAFVPTPGAAPQLPPQYQLPGFQSLSNNKGIEAISLHDSGQLFLFVETGNSPQGVLRAWSVTDDGAVFRGYRAPDNHSPTAALALPDGGMLVLNRSYSLFAGFSIKLVYLSEKTLLSTGVLEGVEIASITPPMNIDNMEALAMVRPDPLRPHIAMLSDNNFSNLMRTLLLVWEIDLTGLAEQP